jgi:hypothetical protein
MIKLRIAQPIAQLGLVLAAASVSLAAPLMGVVALAHAADTVRAEVGKPLQEAQRLNAAGKYKEALAKLRDADGIAAKTPFEQYQINRVRAAAAAASGDNETAIRAFEAVIASGRLSASEVPKFTQGLAGMYYRAKDWPKAIVWINKSLKDSDTAQMRGLLIQAYYSSGNVTQATKDLQAQINADAKAGRAPQEDQLQMMANLNLKAGDKAAYVNTIEKLAAHYPKKSYWADLLNRVKGKPGFSDRLSLDVARLQLATGLMAKPGEFMEASQLAIQAGSPAEAVKIVDQGYKAGALGTGTDAARHQRLKDLATRTALESAKTAPASEAGYLKNKDANGLLALGYAFVGAGQFDKGIALMQQAIKMGNLKNPEDAKLHLGLAFAQAGKKAQAISTLKSVGGSDGTADLARYWIMQLNRPLS